MPTIQDPKLFIEPVPGHPGRRRIVVSYDLVVPAQDVVWGETVTETAWIHGRDLHDAPAAATTRTITELRSEVAAPEGRLHRELDSEVNRVALDVQQDWWRTDTGGGVEPIAEFPDHLQGEIELRVGNAVVAKATTPILTGSWGALGSD